MVGRQNDEPNDVVGTTRTYTQVVCFLQATGK